MIQTWIQSYELFHREVTSSNLFLLSCAQAGAIQLLFGGRRKQMSRLSQEHAAHVSR